MKKYPPKPLDDCPSFDNGETVSLSPVLVPAVPTVFRQLSRLSCIAVIAPGRQWSRYSISSILVVPAVPVGFRQTPDT